MWLWGRSAACGCEDRSAPAQPHLHKRFPHGSAPHATLGFTQPFWNGPSRAEEIRRLFGAGSAGGVRKWDFFFSLPTFICPGDQPKVLCFLLEFLFADLLGLDQMEYSCRGEHRASDPAMPNSRLTQVWILCPLLTLDALGSWFGAFLI